MPAMATHHTPFIAVLKGFACNVEQPLRPLIAVLVHMEVQVQIPLLSKREDPVTL